MQIKLKRKYLTYNGDFRTANGVLRANNQFSHGRSGNGNGRRGDARTKPAVKRVQVHGEDTTEMVVDGLTGRRRFVK